MRRGPLVPPDPDLQLCRCV